MAMRMQRPMHRTLRLVLFPTFLAHCTSSLAHLPSVPQTHPHPNSDSTTHSQSTMCSANARSEVDMEEDPRGADPRINMSKGPLLPRLRAATLTSIAAETTLSMPAASKKPSRSKSRKPVPIPSVHYPFPASSEDAGGGAPPPPL
ncbi:hypothetical protein GGX14DRAFT_446580, partial [Mycena pura]